MASAVGISAGSLMMRLNGGCESERPVCGGWNMGVGRGFGSASSCFMMADVGLERQGEGRRERMVGGRSSVRAQAPATAPCGEAKTHGRREHIPLRSLRVGEEPMTLYKVLGVSHDVSGQEIKTAYRQLARKYHPDVAPDEQRAECTDEFLKIHSAYSTLANPERRAAYDLQLSLRRFEVAGYAGRVTPVASAWEGSLNRSPSSTMYCAPSSFSSSWKGRTWETDQCW